MKIVRTLGAGFAFTLLSTGAWVGCSGDNTPASSGSTSGTGSGSTSGAGTGSASGTTHSGSTASGTASGSASGTASGSASGTASGSASGTASGAASGSTSGTASGATSGTASGMPEGGMSGSTSGSTSDAGDGGGTPDPAMLKMLCSDTPTASPYHAGSMAFTAPQFCVLLSSTCSTTPGITTTALKMEASCETTYGAWTTKAMKCRTQHLCNATMTGNATTHCPHAEGLAAAGDTMAGGPCGTM
jgi:hypothetical protein